MKEEVLFEEIGLEQFPDAILGIVIVVDPLLAKLEVVKLPEPAVVTFIVAVAFVKAFGLLKL